MEEGAKKIGAKSQGAGGEEDLSMEEILQSIRKIIAEDGDESKTADAAKPAANGADETVPGSDVLELTEVVKDDGSVMSLTENTPEPAPQAAASAGPAVDVLASIDNALGQPPAAAPKPAARAMNLPEDSLLSAQAATAVATTFKKMESTEPPLPPLQITPSPVFSSGTTVEDMVAAMLRPMMKEWLDTNLPAIVERVVEREVRKLSKS
jgi:cell pole-organizing protein PopZ